MDGHVSLGCLVELGVEGFSCFVEEVVHGVPNLSRRGN
jgi:hypothetical protein